MAAREVVILVTCHDHGTYAKSLVLFSLKSKYVHLRYESLEVMYYFFIIQLENTNSDYKFSIIGIYSSIMVFTQVFFYGSLDRTISHIVAVLWFSILTFF